MAPTSEYCVVPKVDAFALGYSEVAKIDPGVTSPNRMAFVTSSTYGRDAVIKIVQVDIGTISIKNVDFVTYDALQATGFDVILGRNLLNNMRLEFDFPNHQFKLERVSQDK